PRLLAMSRSDPSAEMPQVEKLPAAERIRLAKKRRAQQLKRYAQWSKAMDKKGHQVRNLTGDDPSRMVRFSQNIVLLEAAARGDIDEGKEAGFSVWKSYSRPINPVFAIALVLPDSPAVRSLLKSGVNPNAANDDGLTALHQCCIDNSEAMCRLLLEFNADVNARDTEQWTPLHAAATCGHIAICRLLVNSGAELLAVNADGNMPYDICEESGTLDYIEGEMARRGITQQQIDDTRLVPEKRMLQDVTRIFEQSESKAACRQQFNKLDSQGANLLHVACASGFLSVIVYLLDQVRVPLDTRDKDGWAPVHVAACWGQLDAIEALAARGADLDSRTTSGETVY
uniref:ANK_REP_REGION domain-containing protein n=1 Tax=Macrostomum lignano TaxID=282301 RepID=A0A1I8I9Z1_9PLAT